MRRELLSTGKWRLGHVVVALVALVVALLVAAALGGFGAAWAAGESAEGSESETPEAEAKTAAPVSDPSSLPYGEANKNEVVYVKGNANGATTGLYVVNEFNTAEQMRVLDPGKYTAISNLSTAYALEQAKGNVSVATLAGEPTYYQGTMEVGTPLPWAISVRYVLDGHDVSAEDLAGQSGALEVVLDVTPLSDEGLAEFSNSYVLQAQGTFSDETFNLSEAEDATVAHVAGSTTVAYMVLPGEGGTFHIHGTAKDFEYSGWQITGMPLSMAIDLRDQDTGELTSAVDELENATSQLADGARELRQGLKSLNSGAQSAAKGASSLTSGAEELASGTGALAQGAEAAADGAEGLASGAAALKSGASQLAEGAKQLQDGIESGMAEAGAGASSAQDDQGAYKEAAEALAAQLQTDPTDMATVMQKYSAMNDAAQAMAKSAGSAGAYQALSELQGGVNELASGASNLAGGADDLSSGAKELASSMGELASGASEVDQGAKQLAKGSSSLESGLDSLASGSFSAYQGAKQLTSGNQALANAVSGMDDTILNELQAAIDEKLGGEFEPHSFVVPSNTKVDAVQFVYIFDGVEKPEKEAEHAEDVEEKSIIDRFFDLFA